MPEATASSTPYWMIGLSTSGSISLGCALVAGRNRVPRPAAGKTALRTTSCHAGIVAEDSAADANIEWIAEVACSILRSYATTSRRCGPASRTAASIDVDKALEEIATLETARRRLIPEIEGLKRLQNTSGDEIARAKRQGNDTQPTSRKPTAAARSRSSSSAIQLDSVEHQRDAGAADAAESAARDACRSARAPRTTWKCGGTASRARSISSRRPHWELGPALGILDFERAARIVGRALLGAERRGRAARARAHQLHARPAHPRARLPRGRAAVPGQRGVAASAPATCRSSRPICSRSPATGISISCRPPKCR